MGRAKIELPESFRFSTEIPVRIGDVNYGRHVGNDAILSFLHDARLQFLAAHGFTELDAGGSALIMTDAAISYLSQARYGDVLTVDVDLSELSRAGFEFIYRICRKGSDEEIARARTGMAFFDYDANRVSRMPQAFRDELG